MNIIALIKKIQDKMNADPQFAAKFGQASNIVSRYPGLQQEIIKIAQIQDERKQQQALSQLPKEVREAVSELIQMLN